MTEDKEETITISKNKLYSLTKVLEQYRLLIRKHKPENHVRAYRCKVMKKVIDSMITNDGVDTLFNKIKNRMDNMKKNEELKEQVQTERDNEPL